MAECASQQKMQVAVLQAAVADIEVASLEVIVKQTIDSTNSWSLQQCKLDRALPFACFAEQQTQGRGRRGKPWLMPDGGNVAMSLAWPMSVSHEQLKLLPLSIALAIAETLESLGLVQVQIKWPNDVYVQGEKIAGILLETLMMHSASTGGSEEGEQQIAVIIGVGLNYDMSSYKQHEHELVAFSYTDICAQVTLQSLAVKPERLDVAARLLQNLVQICQNYPQQALSNLARFKQQYDYCKGRHVDLILDDGVVLSGVARGVNDGAELLVLIDGRQQSFNSAEVSVKAVSDNFSATISETK